MNINKGVCMSERICIAEFLNRVDSDREFFEDRTCFHFYDWFCKDSSLENKAKSLISKLKRIKDSSKIDTSKSYVFFKNNCPMVGSLYDDFRICDMETGDVIYTIVPKSGHRSDDGLGEVWGRENKFNGPILRAYWKDIVKWFNS